MDISIVPCHRAVPDALVIHSAQRPIHQSDPISSSCSRAIEAFPEPRQRCGTYDLSARGLINAAPTAKADFNFA
jgi:hypothetical protein